MSLVTEYMQVLVVTCELVYAVRYSFFWVMALCHWVTDARHFHTASRTIFEDRTTMLSWNIGHQSPSDTMPNLRRTNISTASLQKLKVSYIVCHLGMCWWISIYHNI